MKSYDYGQNFEVSESEGVRMKMCQKWKVLE